MESQNTLKAGNAAAYKSLGLATAERPAAWRVSADLQEERSLLFARSASLQNGLYDEITYKKVNPEDYDDQSKVR
jgi:hypothetical protein